MRSACPGGDRQRGPRRAPAHGLAPSLLGDLLGLIRCDFLSFVGMDTAQQADWFGQAAPLEPGGDRQETEEDIAPFWQHYWDSPCCSYPDQTGDLRSITKISDFYSARQWHNTGMHCDYLRVEHEIMVCMPAGPGADRRSRAAGRRPERAAAVLPRGRPGFLRTGPRAAYPAAPAPAPGLPGRGAPPPRHTAAHPRHWELLHLVAAGHTNAQIARRLGVTEGTVRKHLENVYARLHVSSRTAAVTRAFPDRDT
ncbi:MAG TPA: helix-turn-helix transcriptional regulator [Trebonia sp.]|nr:helix-turn-helix transcriptional regulator [Trebonia sp.]